MAHPISEESYVVGELQSALSSSGTTFTVRFDRVLRNGTVQESGIQLDGSTAIITIDRLKDTTEFIYAPVSTRTYASGTGITSFSLTTVGKRGLGYAGAEYTTEVSANKKAHSSGAKVEITTDHYDAAILQDIMNGTTDTGGTNLKLGAGTAADQTLQFSTDHTTNPKIYWDDSQKRIKGSWGDDAGAAGDFEMGVPQLTTAERDALTWSTNGAVIFNTTTGVTQFREGGAWVSNAAGGSTANASTTVKGVTELATQAEVYALTATGGTGAGLAVTPDVNSRILDIDTTGASIANTNTETTLYTFTIPANTLAAARGVRYTGMITALNASVSLTYKLKYGSTTIASNGDTGDREVIIAEMMVKSAGNQIGYISGLLDGSDVGTATEDETTALDFVITGQFASNASLTLSYSKLEIIY